MRKHSGLFTDTDYQVLNQIALSSDYLSAYEISTLFGKNSYSHIHKSCKKLVDNEMLKSDDLINERNAPKKVFQLTFRGFCLIMAERERESKLYPPSEFPDKIEKFILLLKRWKHLNEGIECFYTIFMKILDLKLDPQIIIRVMWSFEKECHTTLVMGLLLDFQREKHPKDEPVNEEIYFWKYLIEYVLTLPVKTDYAISFEDIIENFKGSPGMDVLKTQMNEKMREGKAMANCYKKYF